MTDYPTRESEGQRSGVRYVAANGHKIDNLGERKLNVMTKEGQLRNITFQVADVNKILIAARRVAQKGHKVILDDDCGVILNKRTGEKTNVDVENGVYEMDLRVKDFTRQGC